MGMGAIKPMRDRGQVHFLGRINWTDPVVWVVRQEVNLTPLLVVGTIRMHLVPCCARRVQAG